MQAQKLWSTDKYFLDKCFAADRIARMDEPFFRFWDRPLEWVADQCEALGITVNQLVFKDAKVDAGLWRKWKAGACEPTFRRFKPIVYAIERHHIARAEAEKKARARDRRAVSRRAAR